MACFLHHAAPACLSGRLQLSNPSRQCLRISNGTTAHAAMTKKGETFQVEVVLREEEAPEVALRRFRTAVRTTNVAYEAKRRTNFENSQDRKKRKMKEGHMKKANEKKYGRNIQTMSDQLNAMEPPPFSEMFGGNTDIFGEGEPVMNATRR